MVVEPHRTTFQKASSLLKQICIVTIPFRVGQEDPREMYSDSLLKLKNCALNGWFHAGWSGVQVFPEPTAYPIKLEQTSSLILPKISEI